MLSTWMRIEVKAANGEDTHVCDLTLQGPKNEAMELIESLLKKEFERPNSRINHLSIKRVGSTYETEILADPKS
jgi:hypothetical protein